MHRRRNYRLPGELGKSAAGAAGVPANGLTAEQGHMLREHARQIHYSRGLREKMFNERMFGEPAWDVLLALYIIDRDRRRVNTRELSGLAGVALTTTLRWLDYLEQEGLICRTPNRFDQRMVYVELSS